MMGNNGTLFSNWKTVHKLTALFIFVSFLVLLLAWFPIHIAMQDWNAVQGAITAGAERNRASLLLKSDLHSIQVDLMRALMVASNREFFEQSRRDYNDARERFLSNCDTIANGKGAFPAGTEKISRQGRLISEAKKGLKILDSIGGTLLDKRARSIESHGGTRLYSISSEDSLTFKNDLNSAFDYVLARIDELSAITAVDVDAAAAESSRIEKRLFISLAIVMGSALFLSVLLGIMATRKLKTRVKVIADMLNRGMNGDLSSINVSCEHDELGELAVALNSMTEKFGEMITRISKSTHELKHVTGSLTDTSRKVVYAAQSQGDSITDCSSAMIQINASIKGVSQGIDGLSLSAAESSSSIMEMAASIEEVAMNVETLSESVAEVSSSIAEMAASVKQIDENVASLTDEFAVTASSVMEMNESIKQVEKNAMDTSAISEEVHRDAESGKAAVIAAIAGIQEIKRSSGITYEVINTLSERAHDIGAILSVIDEVAEQTNLLALNAAIIAAQAGERGRGFAVVADEIKELAERTSASTREISQVIKGFQDETSRAVDAINLAEKSIADGEMLSNRSGEALNKIVAGVNRASEQIDEIARATIEQAKGSQMIREAIEKVLEMVGQIAVATREQGMGGELIMSATERMKELTAQVRVSTREQTKVGNFISKSTEDITGTIQQIKRACDEQSRGSEHIVVAVEEIQNSNAVNLDATKVLNNAVTNLSRQIEILQKEVSFFKVI
jgi:methyl-accepting chemotaxis protein